jgi:hypothetical protein
MDYGWWKTARGAICKADLTLGPPADDSKHRTPPVRVKTFGGNSRIPGFDPHATQGPDAPGWQIVQEKVRDLILRDKACVTKYVTERCPRPLRLAWLVDGAKFRPSRETAAVPGNRQGLAGLRLWPIVFRMAPPKLTPKSDPMDPSP